MTSTTLPHRASLVDRSTEFCHTDVVKIPAVSTTVPAAVSDGHTRRAIVRLLLESGSITAGEIGDRLGLSAAGVRRHLDALIEAGDAEASAAAPADGPDDAALEAAAERIATALSKAGYVATTTRVGGPIHGVQICQHHCPVSHVAEEFPELCETEQQAMAEVLGTHVQRLATIVNGDCACTTHVPLSPAPSPRPPATSTEGASR
ncbi:helix-turn-helix transcriptional regulator [Mycobacterium tuberculosis]|uniref:helix-turn-helix transcriptional regulator n=1 Tax=Mycobacterium tuberculosis TaxID=1773 RepID=UPI0004F2E83D|nr:helix-turn-helix domain-containing protein [Mycobacterium tuberculosis]